MVAGPHSVGSRHADYLEAPPSRVSGLAQLPPLLSRFSIGQNFDVLLPLIDSLAAENRARHRSLPDSAWLNLKNIPIQNDHIR